MKDLVFVCAHPDIPYFQWQTKIYTHNFINSGINPSNIHVLFVMVNGTTNPSEESLKLKNLGINVHHYLDDRKNKRYIPSLRPLALSRWLKEFPELGKCYFYHDGDIIFRELPKFDELLNDEITYLSNTNGYLNYEYILGCAKRYERNYPELPKNELLRLMTEVIGVSIDDIKNHNQDSGGAQYLIKNTDYKFWEKIFDDCTKLYDTLLRFDRKYQIQQGGLQIWTSDMWAVLWNLILSGHTVKVTEKLDFSWATDTISVYEKKPILHMAGVTDNLKDTKFYKGEYITKDPIECLIKNPNHFDYIDKDSSTIKYIDIMKSYIKNEL